MPVMACIASVSRSACVSAVTTCSTASIAVSRDLLMANEISRTAAITSTEPAASDTFIERTRSVLGDEAAILFEFGWRQPRYDKPARLRVVCRALHNQRMRANDCSGLLFETNEINAAAISREW